MPGLGWRQRPKRAESEAARLGRPAPRRVWAKWNMDEEVAESWEEAVDSGVNNWKRCMCLVKGGHTLLGLLCLG